MGDYTKMKTESRLLLQNNNNNNNNNNKLEEEKNFTANKAIFAFAWSDDI